MDVRFSDTMKRFPRLYLKEVKSDQSSKNIQLVIQLMNRASHQDLKSMIREFISLGYADIRIAYTYGFVVSSHIVFG